MVNAKSKVSLKEKLFILLFIGVIILFFNYQNDSLTVSTISVKDANTPESIKGFRIVHLSDMHSKMFGAEGKKLTEKVKSLKPDIIAMTGDMVDNETGLNEGFTRFIYELTQISACFYIPGEEEFRLSKNDYESLKSMLSDLNVEYLENRRLDFKVKTEKISLTGLAINEDNKKDIEDILSEVQKTYGRPPVLSILLSHYPNYIEEYSKYGYRLILAGHVHGGHIRLPVIGGLISSEMKAFPKYEDSFHMSFDKKSMMIVSRGLGNSIIPQRFLNRPEIVLVILE